MSNWLNFFQPPAGEEDSHAYHSRIERKVHSLLSPFDQFSRSQVVASILLLLATTTALLWASIPKFSESYQHFVDMPIGLQMAHFSVTKPLKLWVNEILLTFFFFIIGLEIKREFLVGELVNRKRALMVVFAAAGGMVVPAVIYLLLNLNHPSTLLGWGIPMATDTAFVLGILTCFRNRLPRGIFTFIAALAIIDDIGAILVIVCFYTHTLHGGPIFFAIVVFGLLILCNYAGFRKASLYILLGSTMWLLLEAAGISATIAGILVAFTIPARPKKGPKQFVSKMRELISYFEQRKKMIPLILKDEKQHAILEEVKDSVNQATTPLQRWASILDIPVALIVLPLFTLTNAGVTIDFDLFKTAVSTPISLGILAGLVIGKPLGIVLFSRIALWLKVGVLPEETHFKHILSASLLCGIGFTMSLFITSLSFGDNPAILELAKIAIIVSSIVAGIIGAIMLLLFKKPHPYSK